MDAKAAGELSRRLRVLTHPALLVVDEIGYLPVSQDGAVLFFQLINARHERASTVLTANKGFEEWGHVLGDEVMAAALIDRLLHHCHIVNIRGNSYRMRQHQHCCGPPRNSTVRGPPDECQPRSFAPRFGLDSGRYAPCVQPETPAGHQRENIGAASDVSPKSVQFSVAKSVQFSVAIDTLGSTDNPLITWRDYRSDCAFGVALWGGEGPEEIRKALSRPHFTLYLGRKSCPLSAPMAPKVIKAANPVESLAHIQLPPFLTRELNPERPLMVVSEEPLDGAGKRSGGTSLWTGLPGISGRARHM